TSNSRGVSHASQTAPRTPRMERREQYYTEKLRQAALEPRTEDANDFAGLLVEAAVNLGCSVERRSSEPLAELDYATELKIKNAALAKFFKKHGIPGEVATLTASPRPRHYRTNSKRRALYRHGRLNLLFSEHFPSEYESSQLEADFHENIYRNILKICAPAHFSPLSKALNYVIIRGSYDKCGIIFNVRTINGEVVRKIRTLSDNLRQLHPQIISVFVFVDESSSDYYLESSRPGGGVGIKKIYGSEFLELKLGEMKFLYSPFSFSQVNESLLKFFVNQVGELLHLTCEHRLLDLYCGYGLFGIALGGQAKCVVGMELDGFSLQSAVGNAKHLRPGKRIQYLGASIDADSVVKLLPQSPMPEMIIADPPRSGMLPGVVEELAARGAEKVVHIFCGTDEIPNAVREWGENGYKPVKIIPLDMFSGTLNLETIILFEPQKN
ncbi:MAG: hypothetical protein RRY34_07070, partial [Victivallaceae bacterium]